MEEINKLPKWLLKLWELDASLAREVEKEFNKLNEAIDLINYFVSRVEKGEIRSVTTYDKYKKFLEKYE